ncbi:MAG: hypothetical protein JSV10_02455, partial [Candidatus Zixiibacteriota bacterium]
MLVRKLSLALLVLGLVLLLQGQVGSLATSNPSNGPLPDEDIVQAMEEAKRLVIDDILSGDLSGKAIYMVKSPVTEGTVARGWKADVETFVMPFGKGWFFFIDDYRMANWTHPCRYVFVDFEARKHSVLQATTPPTIWEESISPEGEIIERRLELEEIEESIEQQPEQEKKEGGEMEELEGMFGLLGRQPPSRHAVLLSGGFNAWNNHTRYLNDLRNYYVTLRKYGYPDDQIDVLYADGTAADLDCNGTLDVDGDAREATVIATFNALPAGLDHLHVFVTDHGDTGPGADGAQFGDSRIILWDTDGDGILDPEDELTDVELTNLVIGRNPDCATYVLEQCFSGGCIDDLLTSATRVVIGAACRGDELSWACDTEGDFDEYVYHFTSAVRWAEPVGDTPAQICQDGAAVNADANSNGIVSLREAHDYAVANDSRGENPQFAETPAGQGNTAWIGCCEGTVSCDATQAILDGIAWLRTVQNATGGPGQGRSWAWANGTGTPCVAMTGMAVLAILNNTGDVLADADVLDGLEYLLYRAEAGTDGAIESEVVIGGRATAKVYETSLAATGLIAALEAGPLDPALWPPGMRDRILSAIQGARQYLLNTQCIELAARAGFDPLDPNDYQPANTFYGGWGYPGDPGGALQRWADLSNTQFAVWALRCIHDLMPALDPVPDYSFPADRVAKLGDFFLLRCQNTDGGFTYQPGGGSWGSMSAAGIWSLWCADEDNLTYRARAVDGRTWFDANISCFSNPLWNRWYYYYVFAAAKAFTFWQPIW